VYAFNLGYVIKTSVIVFDKYQKEGTVDLRIRITLNTLSDRNPYDRLRKEPSSIRPIFNLSLTPIAISLEFILKEIK
jgi:hypothetical protein